MDIHHCYLPTASLLVADPDLQITGGGGGGGGSTKPGVNGGGGGGGHPDPEVRGEGEGAPNFFPGLRASVWSKNKRGRPPLEPSLPLQTRLNPAPRTALPCRVRMHEVTQ